MRYIINWLYKKLGGQIRLIKLSQEVEREIISDMANIERIKDYWELHKQAGYQLFAKTKDVKYLGWVDLSEHLLFQINEILREEPKDDASSNGYESQV